MQRPLSFPTRGLEEAPRGGSPGRPGQRQLRAHPAPPPAPSGSEPLPRAEGRCRYLLAAVPPPGPDSRGARRLSPASAAAGCLVRGENTVILSPLLLRPQPGWGCSEGAGSPGASLFKSLKRALWIYFICNALTLLMPRPALWWGPPSVGSRRKAHCRGLRRPAGGEVREPAAARLPGRTGILGARPASASRRWPSLLL